MIEPIRLLAFAFAGADLLFEVDREGVILFATGAPTSFSKTPELAGTTASHLFAPNEKANFSILLRSMSPGQRVGPVGITLASEQRANLSLCYLPQCDRISCTLVKPGKRGTLTGGADQTTGLGDINAFLAMAAQTAGSKGNVALVNLPNLSQLCAKLTPDANAKLFRDIGDKIRGIGATAAARLSDTRFGVIANDSQAADALAESIREAVHERGIDGVKAEQVLLSLKGKNLTPEQSMLALRHVVGRFADGKLDKQPEGDLGEVFEQMVGQTIERAMSFNSTVSDGAFDLAFEPIIDLQTMNVHHYEALTRFSKDESPAETIRFAEDMGLADCFDLAVSVKAIAALERDPEVTTSIGINVSGRTLASPSSFAMLAGLLTKKRAFASRVFIELTESAAITDIPEADKAIQSLRKMGYKVGIDDFGAGAASLHYLHGFTIDFVKADGSLIQAIGRTPRDDALLRSVIASCRELKIETIAEWIDSAEKLKRCTEIGFDYGQGRRFGAALSELPKAEKSLPRVKRKGAQETWA